MTSNTKVIFLLFSLISRMSIPRQLTFLFGEFPNNFDLCHLSSYQCLWPHTIPLACRDITFHDIAIPDAMFPLSPKLLNCQTPTSLDLPTRIPNDGRSRSKLGLRQMKKSKPLTPMNPDDQISDRAVNQHVSYIISTARIPSLL
jgi:hypothetical protein